MSVHVVCDIGGAYTRFGVVGEKQTIEQVEKIPTPATPEQFIKKLHAYTKGKFVSSISGGIRGVLLEDKSGIEYDSILEKWQGVDLVEMIKKHCNVSKIQLENDTALAGLAEATRGAGQGSEIVVYHSVSTGVGGVKIERGVIDRASVGFEPGHQIIDIDRTVLGPDIAPTLENLVSGTAVSRRMGMEPFEIPQTDTLWNELAGYLGQGLRNTVLYWSPEVIVLGGSMITGNPSIPVEAIRRATVDSLGEIMPCPFITVGSLGDEVVLVGAASMYHGE
jgi:predicted NBD/HSP70 family sugar kinase